MELLIGKVPESYCHSSSLSTRIWQNSLLAKTLYIFLIVSWIYKLRGSGASIFLCFLESYFAKTWWEKVNPLLQETIQRNTCQILRNKKYQIQSELPKSAVMSKSQLQHWPLCKSFSLPLAFSCIWITMVWVTWIPEFGMDTAFSHTLLQPTKSSVLDRKKASGRTLYSSHHRPISASEEQTFFWSQAEEGYLA